MPRKPRQFDIGNIYHIIGRGVDGRKTFLSNQDYSRFILGLEFFNSENSVNLWDLVRGDNIGLDVESAERGLTPRKLAGGQTPLREKLEQQRENIGNPIVELMAFTLMPNHYHLIIREIITRGISRYMQKMGGYTGYFNKQYNRRGSLFESTYKCVEIKSDAQLFAVFNYVHTNPVELIEPLWKKQQVKNPDKAMSFLKEEYKWSSYRDCIGIPTFPNVINRDFLLEFFGGEENCKKEVEDWIKFKADNYVQKNQFNSKDFE